MKETTAFDTLLYYKYQYQYHIPRALKGTTPTFAVPVITGTQPPFRPLSFMNDMPVSPWPTPSDGVKRCNT